MKSLLWILAVLVVLASMLAPIVAQRSRPSPGCTSNVTIVRGPHGGPLECVCIGGTLSTCFDPGP